MLLARTQKSFRAPQRISVLRAVPMDDVVTAFSSLSRVRGRLRPHPWLLRRRSRRRTLHANTKGPQRTYVSWSKRAEHAHQKAGAVWRSLAQRRRRGKPPFTQTFMCSDALFGEHPGDRRFIVTGARPRLPLRRDVCDASVDALSAEGPPSPRRRRAIGSGGA